MGMANRLTTYKSQDHQSNMNTKLLKIIGIWTLFVVVAILNAAIREHLLAPMIGHKLALPFSGIMLSIFIFLITIRKCDLKGIFVLTRLFETPNIKIFIYFSCSFESGG